MRSLFSSGWLARPLVAFVVRLTVLLLPSGLLLVEALRQNGRTNLMLWLGTGFQLLVCTLTLLTRGGWRQVLGPSVIVLYTIAFGWMWLGTSGAETWYSHLVQAILLVVPLVVFALHTLADSGAPVLRRARLLADRLAGRQDWPSDLALCRTLPDVKALREALHFDATPALALLSHARPQVRIAALAALEFRKEWRPGQAELVLSVAQQSTGQPE